MAEWQRRVFSARGLTQAPPGPHLGKLAQRSVNTFALYTSWAGQNLVKSDQWDQYGNASGSGFDLVEDGAISDARVVVLDFATLDLSAPRSTLERKGFAVVDQKGGVPSGALERLIADADELWVISSAGQRLTPDTVDVIEAFFRRGRGLYVWGDNAPLFGEANQILRRLFNVEMFGDSPGDQVVSLCADGGGVGLVPGHLVTTGLLNVYEGITIAEVPTGELLRPLIYGSNGRVVAAYYEHDGCRAIVDGGFTRLFHKWDSAGTDRYIANAAAWLLNLERFHHS